MAITINQAPTHPNIANNPLVFSVSSNQISQPQFQFVADIKDENGTLIQRVKQQPNPSGIGVFDFSSIIASQFDDNYEFIPQTWYSNPTRNKITGSDYPITNGEIADIWNQKYILSYYNGGALKEFQIVFGEEYAASLTAPATLYTGNGPAGNPAVSASDNWTTYLNGTLDTNDRFAKWYAGWNLNTIYDWGFDYNSSRTLNTIAKGKGKWVPQQYWGVTYDYNTPPYTSGNNLSSTYVKTFPNDITPYYEFNVGLTDFPTTKKVHWSSTETFSMLIGLPTPPDKMADWYLPKAQWIDDATITYYYADGTSSTGTVPINRDWRNDGGTSIANFKYYMFNSQSVDEQLVHVPVGPMNLYGFASAFRNPVSNPNNYTTSYKITYNGFGWAQAQTFSEFKVKGSNGNPTLWAPAEIGDMGYDVPIIVMDSTETFTTGAYPASTAKLYLSDSSGGSATIHFSQSDELYPGTGYPIASPYQILSDINEQSQAQGCNIRCYLIDNDNYPNLIGTGVDETSGAQYKLLLAEGDRTDDIAYNNTLVECEVTASGAWIDAFSLPVAGIGSCTGFATGRFIYDSVGNSPYIVPQSGYDEFFVPYWDERTYEIDWCGFSYSIDAETGVVNFSEAVCCGGYEAKQFAWINKYGVYDYYTFTLAETITDEIERNSYEQNFVDYSTNTTTIDFDKSRRGTKQYYNKITQRHVIESDWMDKGTADAVREMFFSTDVSLLEKQSSTNAYYNDYQFNTTRGGTFKNLTSPIQDNNDNSPFFFTQKVPVVITNATLTEKTNPRTQKLYKITAEFVYANDLNARV